MRMFLTDLSLNPNPHGLWIKRTKLSYLKENKYWMLAAKYLKNASPNILTNFIDF
jgi:hypothetical protein